MTRSRENLKNLYNAARAVVAAWECSDVAEAVGGLDPLSDAVANLDNLSKRIGSDVDATSLYISRVLIVVEAENRGEAFDVMSACLSENLKYDGAIREWSYDRQPDGEYSGPHGIPLPPDADLEDEDLAAIYDEASGGEK